MERTYTVKLTLRVKGTSRDDALRRILSHFPDAQWPDKGKTTDVVEALRATPELYDPEAHEGYTGEDAAHFIEREFGGER